MKLDLVDSRDDDVLGILLLGMEKTLEVLDGEVGNSDGTELLRVGLVDFGHGLPGVEPIDL